MIHSNSGDLLRSLEPDEKLERPLSLCMNREGYVVVNYGKGDLCLFGMNGKLLKHTRHQDVIQVRHVIRWLVVDRSSVGLVGSSWSMASDVRHVALRLFFM